MKSILIAILLFSFVGCSFTEQLDNGFQSESKIKPLAKSKKMSEKYGDGHLTKFKVKIPLTESSLSYYELEEVLGNKEYNTEKKKILKKVFDSLKFSLFNLLVKLGNSNKIKVSSYFNLPKIDRKYIKGVYINKVFFSTEDCRAEEENCNHMNDEKSDFSLIDKVAVSVKGVSKSEVGETNITTVDGKELNQSTKKNKENKLKFSIRQLIKRKESINLVSYENESPWQYTSFEELKRLSDDEREVFLQFEVGTRKVKKFLRRKDFSSYIKSVRTIRRRSGHPSKVEVKHLGLRVKLKKGVTPLSLYEKIENYRPQLSSQMMIFRLNDSIVEGKKFLESKKFKSFIEEVSVVGRSLYVKVKKHDYIEKVQHIINSESEESEKHLDIYKIDNCSLSNCLDLSVSKINLADVLELSEDVRIDTYLKVRKLRHSDFKYNGYIEVEVMLDLPI